MSSPQFLTIPNISGDMYILKMEPLEFPVICDNTFYDKPQDIVDVFGEFFKSVYSPPETDDEILTEMPNIHENITFLNISDNDYLKRYKEIKKQNDFRCRSHTILYNKRLYMCSSWPIAHTIQSCIKNKNRSQSLESGQSFSSI